MNSTYWQLVPGPSIPTDLYDEVVELVTNGDIVAEGGCGMGRGIHYLIESLKAVNRRPKLYAFDTFGEVHQSEFFEGLPAFTPWGEPFADWAARVGGPSRLFDHFTFYLNNSPARDYLTDYAQFPHWTVAEEFKDDSVSFVLANGAHQPKSIRRELDKWWPKLKSYGKIGLYGHDKGDFKTKMMVAHDFFSDVGAYNMTVDQNHLVITHQ